MEKKKLVLPISILLGCLILGGFFYAIQINKQKLINTEASSNTVKTDDSVVRRKVELIYNNSTGELYPILPDGLSVHSCVWTIWGDHGSDTVVVTKESNMYAMKSSDYIGHFLSNDIEIIKEYNFLPPRVPIYVSCVDWKNNVYSGSIGEYDF